ncbi:MAG: transcriptional regulator [Chloroflexota bacterium]
MYTIKEAAARTGLSPALIRAWERRYGVVRPQRSPSGYRLYDEAAIARLHKMRRLVEDGWLPSEAARAIATGSVGQALPRSWGRGGHPAVPLEQNVGFAPHLEAERTALVQRFVAAAAAHDSNLVEAILDEIGARGPFETVVDDLLLPAAAALGDAWARGLLDAGAEHAASAAIYRHLAAAFRAAGGARAGPPVLVGLPAGSRHELGALAFAVAARRLGLHVVYLGSDVPASSWLEAIRATTAWLVVLGVVTAADRRPAVAAWRAIQARHPDVLIAFGGGAAPEPPRRRTKGSWIRLPDRVVDAARVVASLRFRPSMARS